jgi:hypothetical protein
MKRLIILALVAIAAWYAWNHWPELMSRTPAHEAVIVNQTGRTLVRVRLKVDGQGFVKERLGDGEQVAFPFKVSNDASFELTWEYENAMGEHTWRGGQVPRGPMVQRHSMRIDADGAVTYEARPKGVAPPPA